MVHGFEKETGELNGKERALAEDIARGLRMRIGEKQTITSNEIIDRYMDSRGVKLTGSRLRKIINYIRVTKLVKNLVASAKGYYVETDPQKIKEYCNSLQQRADAIMAVKNSFEYQTHYRYHSDPL